MNLKPENKKHTGRQYSGYGSITQMKTLCSFSIENIGNNSYGPIYDQYECITDELTRTPKYIFQENTPLFLWKHR